MSLIKPHLCDNKEIFLTYKSIVQEKYLMGSNILEPGLHYIGVPSVQKLSFCFIFEHETRQTKGFQYIT